MANNFVFVDELVTGIRWDAKYATWDNFTGKPVDGYEINRIIATKALCKALNKAKKHADTLGFGLLLWDGYRPQRAVDCFISWSNQQEDGCTKSKYYPNIKRSDMITKGYVAKKSSHSRGSAIDLTLYKLDTGELLAMGGSFDLMDSISHHNANGLSKIEQQNRQLLRTIMETSGFDSYKSEWWHYMLKNEPHSDTYFDFPVSNFIL